MKRTVLSRVKFLMLAAIVAIVSMTVVSCSSDDDDDPGYSLSISVSGGGLSDTEIASIEKTLNEGTPNLKNVSEATARNVFDLYIEKIKTEIFNNGVPGVEGTMRVSFYLKDAKTGNTIAIHVLKVTSTGVSE